MSLINDALKKAQSMQPRAPSAGLKLAHATPATTPPAAPPPSQAAAAAMPLQVSPTHTPQRPGMVLALAGVMVVAVIVGLGAVGYFILGGSGESDVVASATTAAPAVVVPSAQATAPVTDAPPAANPAPVAAVAAPTPPVAATPAPQQGSTTASPTALSELPVEPEPVPVRLNRPHPAVQAFINSFEVAGIRSGTNPRALMNNRVYAIGETIGTQPSVKLISIAPRNLGFEDADGNTYELRF